MVISVENCKNFPTPCILHPRWMDCPWNWLLVLCQKTRMLGLPGQIRSLTISSAMWIQCTNVTDRWMDTWQQQRPCLRIVACGKNHEQNITVTIKYNAGTFSVHLCTTFDSSSTTMSTHLTDGVLNCSIWRLTIVSKAMSGVNRPVLNKHTHTHTVLMAIFPELADTVIPTERMRFYLCAWSAWEQYSELNTISLSVIDR